MIITFIGHSSICNHADLAEKIKASILENMIPNEHIRFYCGGYGEFDQLCAYVCRSIKELRKNCEVVYVTPYITDSHQNKIKYFNGLNLYDSTLYPGLENVPYRFAIVKRNEWMITEADLIITYIKKQYGRAYKSFLFAQKKNKQIINIAN